MLHVGRIEYIIAPNTHEMMKALLPSLLPGRPLVQVGTREPSSLLTSQFHSEESEVILLLHPAFIATSVVDFVLSSLSGA